MKNLNKQLKLSLILLSLVIFTTGVWWFANRKPPTPVQASTPAPAPAENKIKNLVLKPRVFRNAATASDNAYAACLELWQDVDSLDLSATEEELISMASAFDFNLCKPRDPSLKNLQQAVMQACFKSEVNTTQKKSYACKQALIFYRSATHVDKDLKVSSVKDFPTLVDMLVTLFGNQKDLDIKKMREIVQQMKELEGEIPLVQKLSIMTESINAIAYEKEKNTPELWEKLSNDFDQLDERIKNDPQFADFQILVKTQGMQLDKIPQWAAEAIQNPETKAKGHELMGYANWKNGNRVQAIADLENAIRTEPGNEWYPQILKKIKNPSAGINDYQVIAKMGFSFDELFEFSR